MNCNEMDLWKFFQCDNGRDLKVICWVSAGKFYKDREFEIVR